MICVGERWILLFSGLVTLTCFLIAFFTTRMITSLSQPSGVVITHHKFMDLKRTMGYGYWVESW